LNITPSALRKERPKFTIKPTLALILCVEVGYTQASTGTLPFLSGGIMFRATFWLLVLPLFFLGGCTDDNVGKIDTGDEPGVTIYSLAPSVGGQGTTMDIVIQSNRSKFIFGETALELGDDIVVTDVTVSDGYTAVAHVEIAAAAELGERNATVTISETANELEDAFEVVAESIVVDPDNGKMGETLTVAVVGSGTEWESGYTWTSFGDGIDVLEFNVLSKTLATAKISIRPDAAPGLRDVTMEDGPHVVSLYDGFTVDRAVITAFFDPEQAYQGDTVEFTIKGLDTNFKNADSMGFGGTTLKFWDEYGENADVMVTELTVLDAENIYGRMRLSNAARIGMRDVLVTTSVFVEAESTSEAVLVPDAFEVLDALPDLANVAISLNFYVARSIDNATCNLNERVVGNATFYIPLDPPCGPASPMGDGPKPYDQNGVFPVPPSPDPVDCPYPKTVSAGDVVWYESDENIVSMYKEVDAATNAIYYVASDLTLTDYRFNKNYDLHTQGDPAAIPEVLLEGVQPTVPSDWYLTNPQFCNDLTIPRTENFNYSWTPAMTYPTAIFVTQISGVTIPTEDGDIPAFIGSIPWDDGVHAYTPYELSVVNDGPASFIAVSSIKGPLFGFPFSTIQANQSGSVLQTSAYIVLE